METPTRMSDEEFAKQCNSLRERFQKAVREEFGYSGDGKSLMSMDHLNIIFNVSSSLMKTTLGFMLEGVTAKKDQLLN